MSDAAPDPAICPTCSAPNRCAMAATDQADNGASCWCRDVTFDAAALARIPDAARGRACLCRSCATGAGADPQNGKE